MKNLKDQLLKRNINEGLDDYKPYNDVMFSMITVSNGDKCKAYLFKDLKELYSLYDEWGGYDDDEIRDICNDSDKLKKNESMVHVSSKNEYEIITALK
jgi:hypothetical protein